MRRFLSASLPLALAGLAAAQTGSMSSTATGTAGSVSGKSSTGSTYSGLPGSAMGASIGYSTPGGGTSNEDKFASVSGSPAGRTFAGTSSTSGTTSYGSQGGSSVNGGNSPTYYNVGFSQQISDTGTPVAGSGGGTYDPWPVHLGDVSKFSPSADLYFQAGLRQSGAFGATGFSNLRTAANYEFDAYIDTGSVRQNLFSFLVGPTGLSSVSYTAPAGFQTSLLGSNADDFTVGPDRRLGAGMSFNSAASLYNLLNPLVMSNGSLTQDLQFGILRQSFAVPTSGNSTDTLFSWHADVITRIGPAQSTPEPATVAALGLGVTALLRRRKRA